MTPSVVRGDRPSRRETGHFEQKVCSHVVDPRLETADSAHLRLEEIWADVHDYQCPICSAEKEKFYLHLYNPDLHGDGCSFVELNADEWCCPVTGADKAKFRRTSSGSYGIMCQLSKEELENNHYRFVNQFIVFHRESAREQ